MSRLECAATLIALSVAGVMAAVDVILYLHYFG